VADLSLDKFDSSKLGNVSDADIVTCCDVIEHLIDPKFAMEQSYRALKPGGRLYVSTPNMAHWRRVVAMAKGDFPRTSGDEVLRDGGHVCYFCPGDLTNLLKSVGFSEVTMSYRSSDPVPTEYIRPMDVLAGLQIWHDFTYMIAEAIKN
jgi:SAM-dependent methyltransferase